MYQDQSLIQFLYFLCHDWWQAREASCSCDLTVYATADEKRQPCQVIYDHCLHAFTHSRINDTNHSQYAGLL